MALDAKTIEGFVGGVLAPRFDDPVPTPKFHKELWELCCTEYSKIAIAAPRGHAKSTSVTLGYVTAMALFRERDHILIVSDTEGQAAQFLGDIKVELEENEHLISLFGVSKFLKDNATELICEMDDGYQFRIIAKGSEQKVRGLKWRNKRPNLIVGDDLENDEIVMNKERREKFLNWFFKALVPCGSKNCLIRIVGTILHMASMLEKLLNSDSWVSKRYRAHNEDFSEILWPEMFSKERLQAIRQDYIDQGIPEGYSQEYLNFPLDEENAYFRQEDFLEFDPAEIVEKHLYYYSAIDFAITQKEHSDFTVICTVAVDSENNIYVIDVRRGRWDSKEIIDEMFSVHSRYNPEIFTAEAGMIEKALGPFLRDEMFKRNQFINLNPMVPVKDKPTRARSIQARLRQGGVFFNKDTSWYHDLELEMLHFPRDEHDDQVDALAWIGLTLDKVVDGMTPVEVEDEQWEEFEDMFYEPTGVSLVTGY